MREYIDRYTGQYKKHFATQVTPINLEPRRDKAGHIAKKPLTQIGQRHDWRNITL